MPGWLSTSMGCTWSVKLVCWSHNQPREEWILQQTWAPPAPEAPPAQGLHQTLLYPFYLVSELSFQWLPSLKHAQHSRMLSLCWQPCESQHKALCAEGQEARLSRGSQRWEPFVELLSDHFLSPWLSGVLEENGPRGSLPALPAEGGAPGLSFPW